MQEYHPIPKAGNEMRFQLGRQSYLRHKDQDIPAFRQGLFRRLEIYLGFTATGNAVEEKGFEYAFLYSRQNFLQNNVLF